MPNKGFPGRSRWTEVIPALVMVPIEDLAIDDVLWGWEEQGNWPRKGWHVEPEGVAVGLIAEHDDRWVVNSFHFLKDRQCPAYFLIEGPV